MSTRRSLLDSAEETDPDDESLTDHLGIDPRYEVVDHVDGSGGLEHTVDPWLDWQYPLNRDSDLDEGVIRSGSHWQARQRPDGSGILESSARSTVYGIRTPDGTVVGDIDSSMCLPYHSEYHQRRDDDSGEADVYDYDWLIRFPLRFATEVLAEQTDFRLVNEGGALDLGTPDGEGVVNPSLFYREVVSADILDDNAERGVLLTHRSGRQVYVGFDSTSHRGNELFGFVTFDGTEGIPAPSARDALSLLRPNDAAAAPEQRVERQGEWFLIPSAEDCEGTIQKPGVGQRPYGGSPLDNHVPRDWRTVVDDETFMQRFQREFAVPFGDISFRTPQDCVDILHTNEHIIERDDPYATVQEIADGIEVRGTIRHREQDHKMSQVDDWRRATTHDWEVVTVEDAGGTMAVRMD